MLGYERFETGCTARHFCDIWAYVREQCLWVLVYYKFMPLNHSKISLFVCSNKPTCEVPSRRYIYILLVMPLVNLPRTTQENVGPRNVSSDVNIYIYIYVSLQLSVQNAVSAQPCVGKLGISLVLLNFLGCNCGL